MASKTYVNGSTVIDADWLNDVDATVYEALAAATTPAEVRAALDALTDVEIAALIAAAVDDLSGVTDAATARTNLDVYSTTEVDTQAIVFAIALG